MVKVIKVRLLVVVSLFFVWLLSDVRQADSALPNLAIHPLPAVLASWNDSDQKGDYFDQVEMTSVGYLIWSDFPVKVFIEPIDLGVSPSLVKQYQGWVSVVSLAVEEWSRYFPLLMVADSDLADIKIWRKAPTPRISSNNLEVVRARSATARYEFYLKTLADQNKVIAHYFTIDINPNQSLIYMGAAARHELGHALGIWGHSQEETDVLYFSQVKNPPAISVRDVNTLKRVYQQPTRLGWVIKND